MPHSSFLLDYLQYTSDTEPPVAFHRWSAIAGIGALLERNIHIPFGHSKIYPNQYIMFIGTAGTRKTTAIMMMRDLMIGAGYTTIASDKTSKEKFLMDLAGEGIASDGVEDIMDRNLFGSSHASSDISPMAIMADEANDFFGFGNMEFLSMLGSLWDKKGSYEYRIKNGKSLSIPNPIISILAGNTPTGFAQAFPPEIIGQGFFSRLNLVYSVPSEKQIAWPRTPTTEETNEIIDRLKRFRTADKFTINERARKLLEHVYKTTVRPTDSRFDSYFNRRFTHLLKLCIICTIARGITETNEDCVVEANTYLSYIESLMSKALGEFGKAKNADVSHKILQLIENSDGIKPRDIFKAVSGDLSDYSAMGDIMNKLIMAEKVQNIQGLYLPMRKRGLQDVAGIVDTGYLTEEELAVKG